MSFQNSYSPDGSININVVPSFGRIVQVPENQKLTTVHLNLFRFLKLKDGELGRVPFINVQLILILLDMFLSAHKK